MFCGLEEDKITGLSIRLSLTEVECIKSFGSRRNYRVLKLVLLPIHSFWKRKSYMVLKRSSSSAGWKKIRLQDTQTSSAEVLVWTRKKLHGTQTR